MNNPAVEIGLIPQLFAKFLLFSLVANRDDRADNLAVPLTEGAQQDIDILPFFASCGDPMLKIDVLSTKAPIELWFDQSFEDDRADKIDDMLANNLNGGTAFELNDATVGVEIAIIEPDNIDALSNLIENRAIETKCIALFGKRSFD